MAGLAHHIKKDDIIIIPTGRAFLPNTDGSELDSSELETYSVNKHLPNYHTKTYDEISNTVAGTDIQVIVDLTSLS